MGGHAFRCLPACLSVCFAAAAAAPVQQAAHCSAERGIHSCASAVLPLSRVQSQQGGKLTPEQIQGRVAAVASVCIEQLAEHTRRGKAGELWDLLLPETHSRLDRLVAAQQAAQQAQQAEGGSGTAKKAARKGAKAGSKRNAADAAVASLSGSAGEELAAATASAARGVALLTQLLEHGRGCRVDDYEPLFQLAARLVKPEFVNSSSGSSSSSSGGAAAAESAPVEPLPRGASAVFSDFLHPSLSAQVLRLLLALTLSHAKVAGASLGPASIGKAAPQWAPVFQRAPARELLPFIRSLISYPGGFDVARFFSQQMLGTLGRCLLAGRCRCLRWLGSRCWQPLLLLTV